MEMNMPSPTYKEFNSLEEQKRLLIQFQDSIHPLQFIEVKGELDKAINKK